MNFPNQGVGKRILSQTQVTKMQVCFQAGKTMNMILNRKKKVAELPSWEFISWNFVTLGFETAR